MTTNGVPLAAAAVLLATVLGAGVSVAQGNQAPVTQAAAQQQAPDEGMMGRGGMMGHGGMMGQMDPAQMNRMMEQMNRMMENCNRMMEGMQRSPSAPSDTQPGHR
jgi:hypothetical protein